MAAGARLDRFSGPWWCWAILPAALLFAPAPQVLAQDGLSETRPKIGLVLSGGGARGAAHIGVLRVLEEQRIPIDYIAGTSMGAAIGGLYAAGVSVELLEHAVEEIDWSDAFNDRIQREDRSFRRKRDDDLYVVRAAPGLSDTGDIRFPAGLVQGQKVDLLLKSFTFAVANVHDFDQLSIPFRAVASDIVTGERVVLQSGDLAGAIRASMSVPAVLAPVELDGRLLVDGGLVANLPVDVVREMGADIVIAVDVSTPLLTREQVNSVLAIAEQLTTLLINRNTVEQRETLGEHDVLITPELGDVTAASFNRAREAIDLGKAAALREIERINPLGLSAEDYARWSEQHGGGPRGTFVIDFVRLYNDSLLADEAVRARLGIKAGEPLNILALRQDIDEIYGLELFERVRYEIVEEDGQTGLELYLKSRSWGPNYLRFGAGLADDFRGGNFFNLAVAYTRTLINRLGGEWRTGLAIGGEPGIFSELYQPLDFSSRYFIEPRVSLEERTVKFFEGGNFLADFRVQSGGVRLAGGREFGTWGELRLGLERFTGETSVRVGDPSLPDMEFEGGEVFLRLSVDELDNFNFPRRGSFGTLEWRLSRQGLGADSDFEQITLDYLQALGRRRHSVLLRTRLGTTIDGTAPVQSVFRAGGFLNVSGFDQNELSGQHFGVVGLGFLRRLGDVDLLPAYLGASLELGNVWDERSEFGDDLITAGSVFFGLDSFLGPLYLGYGRAEGGNSSFYLFLGRLF